MHVGNCYQGDRQEVQKKAGGLMALELEIIKYIIAFMFWAWLIMWEQKKDQEIQQIRG